MSHDLLSPEDAARRIGLSVSTLAKRRLTGDGPSYIKLGGAVRYRPADLDEYIAARIRRSTSDAATVV